LVECQKGKNGEKLLPQQFPKVAFGDMSNLPGVNPGILANYTKKQFVFTTSQIFSKFKVFTARQHSLLCRALY